MKTETGYVELKDGKIYYEVAGEGDTLVLSHAGFVDSGMWDDQWKPFAEKYRVIRYDMRGYGKSSKLDAPVVRRDDLNSVLDHLKVEQAHVLGCSMGGEIVIDYALEHPERVLSLIAVSAVPSGFQMQGKPPDELMQMMEATQKSDLKHPRMLNARFGTRSARRDGTSIGTDASRWIRSRRIRSSLQIFGPAKLRLWIAFIARFSVLSATSCSACAPRSRYGSIGLRGPGSGCGVRGSTAISTSGSSS